MALQFKIQIRNITKPPVWRRVLLPESSDFEYFHLVIQVAFGWENYHLYQFSKDGYRSDEVIGVPFEDDMDWGPKKRNAAEVQLNQLFTEEGQKLLYNYDFGDDWEHLITLEKITPETIVHPKLLAAKGACPPEDCGGPWGYENLKVILSDKKHPEHKEMKAWLGMKARDEWDAAYVDIREVNSILQEL